jgi:carbonic anhydrase
MRILFLFFALLTPLYGYQVTPEEALKKLMDGNARYANDEMLHPRRDLVRRQATLASQEPFAIILACSDSRVPPEILFDQGVGDLFVVRVAGNVVGPIELDSIEFAALYLHSSLIFVLGHENCSAVTAVLNGQTKDIKTIAKLIKPAVKESRFEQGNRLENAIKDNVENGVHYLKRSPELAHLIDEKQIAVVGGYYNLKTGVVTLLKDFE